MKRLLLTAVALTSSMPMVSTALGQDKAPISAPAAPAESKDDILVEGRGIKGVITRPEAQVPSRERIVDFEPIGYEVVLLQTTSGQWYRATLLPPCIGDSRMVATSPNDEPGIGVMPNPDGSFDYRSTVYVRGDNLPAPDGRCTMISLVKSDPPKGAKNARPPRIKPEAPVVPARAPAKAPDGGPIYPVEWQERPTPAQLQKMAGGWSGSGWILCQTAADYKVRGCRIVSESPRLTGVANRMKLASGSFRVRPPTVGGQPAIGAWVAIGFDFAAKRKEPIPCSPSNPRDPC